MAWQIFKETGTKTNQEANMCKEHYLDKNGKTQQKKSRIRKTLNLSTNADHRTDIFLGAGMVQKRRRKRRRKKVTRDM